MKHIIKILIIFTFILPTLSYGKWKVDLSRRNSDSRYQSLNDQPDSAKNMKKEAGFFKKIFGSKLPSSDVVILNTKEGFLPKALNLKKGQQYRVSVVNVNEREKNVSFIMDSFSEHHATYYGKIRSFIVKPEKEGVYSFQCPETGAEGKMVVYLGNKVNPNSSMEKEVDLPQVEQLQIRQPASE